MIEGAFHGTRGELVARIHQLPALLSGAQPDPTGAVEGLLRALGMQALTVVKESYVDKARGGTDAAGITWQPLSRRYVAYGRRHPGLAAKRGRAARAGRSSRPLLTAKQDARWKAIFAGAYRRLNAAGDADAGGNAAALAWAIIKREGGKTILGEYGNTSVEIGRDTGRLLNSLSPGAPDNVVRPEAGGVSVGTNVQYAEHFHKRRPLWPEDGQPWPQEWEQRLLEVLEDGVAQITRKLTGG